MNHHFTPIGQVLIIPAQSATLIEPPERALYDPSLGQHHEPFVSIRPPHDLQLDAAALSPLPHPFDEFARVRAIGPDHALKKR